MPNNDRRHVCTRDTDTCGYSPDKSKCTAEGAGEIDFRCPFKHQHNSVRDTERRNVHEVTGASEKDDGEEVYIYSNGRYGSQT